MSKFSTLLHKSRGPISVIMSVVLSVLFVVTVVQAATTISSNISTGGTLSVTGSSTLTGIVTVGNNLTVPSAYGLDTATAGALNIGTSTATSITIADTGVLTTLKGTLNVDEAATFDTTLGVTGVLTATTGIISGNNIIVPSAYGLDTATAGVLNIGTSTATSITIADTGVLTTLKGTLNVDEAATFDTTLGVTGAATFSSDFTLDNTATSTVTMTKGLNFDSNTLVIDSNANRVGVLTATPNTAFEVVGTASTTNLVIGGGTSISRHLSDTTSLTFGAIGANSCGDQAMTVTGAVDGDTVSLGIPDALANASSTITFMGWVSAADTVSVRLCQTASTAGTFSAATVRADIWQH